MSPELQPFPCPEETIGRHCNPDAAAGRSRTAPSGAIATERLHCVLKRMSDDDWTRLKALMIESLGGLDGNTELDALERVFRHNESIGHTPEA